MEDQQHDFHYEKSPDDDASESFLLQEVAFDPSFDEETLAMEVIERRGGRGMEGVGDYAQAEDEASGSTLEERAPLVGKAPRESQNGGNNNSIQNSSMEEGAKEHSLRTATLSGSGFVILLTAVSALGGFLFGYDTGVVSGAVIMIRRTFLLSSTSLEIFVSATIAAAAVSAFLSGFLCDLIGRRVTLILASAIFTVGAILLGASFDVVMLIVGRVVVGVAIGMAAMAVPMYIAESAPAGMRGKLVVVNVMFLTGGQFVATFVDGAFSYLPSNLSWRFMLGLAAIPSIIMFIGLLFMPESPRWLIFHKKPEKAWKVLQKIHPPNEVQEEFNTIMKDYKEHSQTKMGCLNLAVKFCTTRSVLLALFVGCSLQFFQQFGGINTVMYYSASIIQMAGFPDRSAIWLATVPGTSNFLFTIVGLLLVDRIGRRKLLIGSMTGIVFSFLLLSGTFAVMSRFSPQAVPYDVVNGTCQYRRCGRCVANSECGFCADVVVAVTGNNTGNTDNNYYGDIISDDDGGGGGVFNGTCLSLIQLRNGSTIARFPPRGSSSGLACAVAGEGDDDNYNDDVVLFPNMAANFHEPSSKNPSSSFHHKAYNIDSRESSREKNGRLQRSLQLERKLFVHSCPDSRLAPLAIVGLFLYIAFFAPGMGPLPWTVNSEIYPTWARSTAISIATMTNWVCNLVVSMTFLTMADNLGQPATFGFYAAFSLLGLVVIVLFVPETKGRSLEEMDSLFQRPHFVTWFRRFWTCSVM